MKIGFYQFDVKYGKPNYNLSSIVNALSTSDFDLILLPELCTSGSIFLSHAHVDEMAEALTHSRTLELLQPIANQKQGVIIAGIIEKVKREKAQDSHFNSALIVGPEGYLGVHRKVFLAPPDKRFFAAGNEFKVHEIKGVKVGVLMCYDIWFEEGICQLAKQGVQLIVNPSNYCGEDSLETIIKQAQKYQVYIISANRLGMDHDTETGIQFIGKSILVSPQGEVLALGGTTEQLFTTEIHFNNKHN
ncbi:nitrilase-related carbon-nitrogen hydrolase [Pseudoalteromonas piscicida]|uniref:CN hydrolase domain-containing protein n=1 Tax=Pseudoalteromonas piscicida TaxID=43662 RepID=A0A2A5JP82_PSEO7|nr:nitrilase-related carbon-nitrogen hydrolase [Pseudoalteromonas piscicida]PCK31187.1 hypothetical protein CEX98_14110 [Pseudoalteromonas piscicida]